MQSVTQARLLQDDYLMMASDGVLSIGQHIAILKNKLLSYD
jgi:hypothetical protein